jgi:hypothetical protein
MASFRPLFNEYSYSTTFTNPQSGYRSTSVTQNAGTSPIGDNTAVLVTITANDFDQYIRSLQAQRVSTIYTFSVYAKKGASNWLLLYNIATGSSSDLCWFNLDTGTLGTIAAGVTAIITPVGNGWYRCSVSKATASTIANNLVDIRVPPGDNLTGCTAGNSIFIWGAQLEQGSSAGTYVPMSGIATSAPRFDHNPTTGESLGLLVEEARTNTIVSSSVFNTGAWTQDGAVLTANAGVAPDGTTTATSISQGTGSNRCYLFDNSGVTGSKVFSFFVKANAGTSFQITATGGLTPNATATVNLSSVTVSGFTSATIQAFANGWYRVLLPVTVSVASGGSTYWQIFGPVSSVFIWGFQLEAGSFPTSYIPTQNEGSFLLHENNSLGIALAKRFELNQDSSPNSNAIAFSVNYSNGTRISSRDSNTAGTIDSTLGNVWSLGGSHKYGYGLRLNDFVVASGSSIATDTAGTFPPNLDSLSFGAIARAASLMNNAGSFRLSRLAYWPTPPL